MGRKVYPDDDNNEFEEVKVPSFMPKKRYCRDVPFLILFIVFWFGMIIVATSAVKEGDPKRLM